MCYPQRRPKHSYSVCYNEYVASTKYLRLRRARLMQKDPHCYWCRKPLKEYYATSHGLPDDFPTIDHLVSRFSGKRKEVYMKERTLVLSCPKCNQDRANEEMQKHIWKTRWKAGQFPRRLKYIGIILKWIRNEKQYGSK